MGDRQLVEHLSTCENDYWWFVGRRKIITTLLKEYLNHPHNTSLRILDIGCGTGGTTIALSKFGEVCGSDYSAAALNHARESGLDKLIRCSASNLPFRPETFDTITILDVLEYIKDDVQALREIRSSLKKDGIIFISVPAFQSLWSKHDVAVGHLRRYNTQSLLKVIRQSGLQELRISYFISFLFPFLGLYRIITRKFKLEKQNNQPKIDVVHLPVFIDKTLQQFLILESKILRQRSLPFGLSLFCIVRINHNATATGMNNTSDNI
jgi:ubiquinone/menaquinone biosynthesis C-methylase UbiE